MCRTAVLVIAFCIMMAGVARAQPPATIIMHKLLFLSGTWNCTVSGGSSDRLVQTVTYSFSPDGLWMTEISQDAETGAEWSTQIWGYDSRMAKLVAYSFTPAGVFTKTVDGWVDGEFRSRRDDNGASVLLRPVDSHSIQWVVESADHSSLVREDCVQR